MSLLIARLIADKTQLETRLNRARGMLAQQGMTIAEAGPIPIGGSSADSLQEVLQIKLGDSDHLGDPVNNQASVHTSRHSGDSSAFRHILETCFDSPDMVISDKEFAAPQLFVSDMDSTMIGQECIDELADFAGLKAQVADITERAMQGEIDFEMALRQRVQLLSGLDQSAIAQCLEQRITPMPGAKKLVEALKSLGCRTILVTGGFHHFADEVAQWLGFDRVVGNRLAVKNGKLTGALDGPIVDSGTKLAVLSEESALLPKGALTMASGDGANDIPMLEAADFGFAYHAKPAAREAANGSIERDDLTAILKLFDVVRP